MRPVRLLALPLLVWLVSPVLGNPVVLPGPKVDPGPDPAELPAELHPFVPGPDPVELSEPPQKVVPDRDPAVTLCAMAAIILAGMFGVGHLGSRHGFRSVRLAFAWLPLGFLHIFILLGGAIATAPAGEPWLERFLLGCLAIAVLGVPLWTSILALLARRPSFRSGGKPRLTWGRALEQSLLGNGAPVILVLAFLALAARDIGAKGGI
jgi:hypothetical protein